MRIRAAAVFGALIAGLAVLVWIGVFEDGRPLRERLGDDAPGEGWIYDDWDAARLRAADTGRPIFALFRCVP